MALFEGTPGDDTLVGTSGDDTIHGHGGNDEIDGNGGNDIVTGDEGDDFITIRHGQLDIDGGSGTDTLRLIQPGIGPDGYEDGYYVDLRQSGTLILERDLFWGGFNYSRAAGFENVTGSVGGDVIWGTAGVNILAGEEGSDTLSGGAGDDLLLGDGSIRLVNGQLVITETGVGAGFDTLIGGDGNDRLVGGAEVDFLYGQVGNDLLEGGTGGDFLNGGSGDDTLLGGEDDDGLAGYLGNDILDGGAGTDTAHYLSTDPALGGVTASLQVQGTPVDMGVFGFDTLISIENLTGTSFSDDLTGDDGANWLWGSTRTWVNDGFAINNDAIYGLGGNDLLMVASGDHSLDGGSGIDTVAFTEELGAIPDGNRTYPSLTLSLSLQGSAQATGVGDWTLNGIENLSGWIGDDQLIGDDNANLLAGSGGSDILSGGAGNDVLLGEGEFRIEGGEAVLYETWWYLTDFGFWKVANNILDGGEGDDRMVGGRYGDIYYVDSSGDVVVEGASGLEPDEVRTGLAAYSLAAEVETLTGLSATGQSLAGNVLANLITGAAGNDVLAGGAGADTLNGGDGSDRLYANLESPPFQRPYYGNPTIFPLLDTGAEIDTLSGGAGGDQLFAGYGDNVDGGADSDSLLISFQGATSGVTADFRLLLSGPVVIGGATIQNIEAIEWLEGSEYDDFLSTGYGIGNFAPTYGRGGNDHIVTAYYSGDTYGGDGNDTIDNTDSGYGFQHFGEGGDDILIGGSTYERLDGGAGNDTISGNSGFDTLYGGTGNDLLDGGDWSDSLYGEAGSDTLNGGLGADTMAGGADNDLYHVDDNGDVVTELAGEGTDEIRTALGSKAPPDRLVYVLPNFVENLTGTSAGAQGVRDNSLDNVIIMGGGHDLVVADAGGVDSINGGGGNDFIYHGDKLTAADTSNGGAGTDTIGLLGNYTSLVFTAANLVGVERMALYTSLYLPGTGPNNYNITMHDANVAAGTEFFVTAASLQSNESLVFNGAAETNGRFTIHGGGGADTIIGGAGGDFVIGNAGNDSLYGLGGQDFLIGGLGADQLRGGAGGDRFLYQNVAQSTAVAADQILDFQHADRIDLSTIDANANAGDGNSAFTFIGSEAFHNVAGELRAWQNGGNWFVEGDTNGDGLADLVIQVTLPDATPLGGADFIL